MTQTAIPFLFMRGGTSRGPYFSRADLPKDAKTLAQVLRAVLGTDHSFCIDGLGGSSAVTTKVAMLSRSDDGWADIDYFFAQFDPGSEFVDFKPTCFNILFGVGPAAIEMGLIPPKTPQTEIKILATNTGARVIATIETPDEVNYEGTAAVDGVPGTAAPVSVRFLDTAGSATGALLPTGHRTDRIGGIEVTCLDLAMPVVMTRAEEFGKTGYETAEALNADHDFMTRMLNIRLEASEAMGMGDPTHSVIPKFALLAPPRSGGAITARYFMPWKCHPTMAVSGAQCIAACALMTGTVAEGLSQIPRGGPANIRVEHPAGSIDVFVDYTADPFTIHSTGLTRTARKLAAGEVFIPRSVWVAR